MKTKVTEINWHEVEAALKEETPSGYKIACIEAQKIFIRALKNNSMPTEKLSNTLKLFGWKFSNVDQLREAIGVCQKLVSESYSNFSTFEAEDTIEAFRLAVADLGDKGKKITWQKNLLMSLSKSETKNGFDVKKVMLFLILIISFIKFITDTELGRSFAILSNLFFGYLMGILFVSMIVLIFALIIFIALDKKSDTKIKSINEK